MSRQLVAEAGIRTEKDLQERVRATCRDLKAAGVSILFYHTWSSLHSPKGFPDCLILAGDWVIALELKSARGELSPEQASWLAAFARLPNGIARRVRPADWPDTQAMIVRIATTGRP